ncbi:MAG TPA: hypothetical protein DHV14_13815 [Micrococcales bacterium]|uniref:ATP-grasp domain-containing protein n=1 Tax=Miniimonas TaxID=947525 RepID=UPI000D529E24|nr:MULTISPECIES: hypothetical protein [Miniimonas]HCX86182.1 hypothetical protein [Micrococcales bacterium]
MTTTPRIALVTSSDNPQGEPEDRALVVALTERDAQVSIEIWDDPAVDWSSFDLVVLRSVWDYSSRRAEFLDWAARVPTLRNPANVVRWNSDKHYVRALAEHGLPVVETLWLEPDREYTKRDLHNRFPAREDFVVKPAISAGSVDTGRYTATDADSRRLAIKHAERLLSAGRSVMVQRYMPEIDTFGESALVFLHGEYSHAMHKGAMLMGEDNGEGDAYTPEVMEPWTPSQVEIDVASEIITEVRRLVPGRSMQSRPLLYARVDLVIRGDQQPLLMELELVEPALYTSLAPGSLDRFASAILREVAYGPDPRNDTTA